MHDCFLLHGIYIRWHFNSKFGINLWQRLCLKRIHHYLKSREARFWITVRQTIVHVRVVRGFTHTKHILSSMSRLTHRFSCVHNLSYGIETWDWNTHLDKSFNLLRLKILHCCVATFFKYSIFLHRTFFETPGILFYLREKVQIE